MMTASIVAYAQASEPQSLPKPNWERVAALRVAANPPESDALSNWLQQIENGESAMLLQQLQHSEQAAGPAFEAQLHKLAIALAETSLDSPVDELLAWLASYSSQVLVAHEESAAYGVPLYLVAAAAKGSQAERQRRLASRSSSALLAADPLQWTQRYLAASAVEREGFIQSLQVAPIAGLVAMADQLQSKLPAHAELAAAVGIIASRLSDPQLFLAAYRYSSGADSVALLREAGWRLDAAQRSQVFTGVMALPASDKTALGISMLAPSLQSNPEVSSTLLKLLDDQDLGAAAALALAGHPDAKVQASLQGLLQEGGLKGRRAALALDKNTVVQATGLEQ